MITLPPTGPMLCCCWATGLKFSLWRPRRADIPIAHISGGDVTLGAADEYYRHCISKMAAVHFPSCADSAARLVRMGEAPGTVFCVGGLGDENIRTMPKMGRRELCDSTGFPLMQPLCAGDLPPRDRPRCGQPGGAGAGPVRGYGRRGRCVLAYHRLQRRCRRRGLHPHDAGFCRCPPGPRRLCAEPWPQAPISAMEPAALVAGNSSSGVVETPTFRVPTVNIGRRQAGRTVCANVLLLRC